MGGNTLKHNYETVADLLRSHPEATLDMMTPGGFILLTPELGAGLLAGGTASAHPGCPGSEVQRAAEADEILCQTFSALTQDKTDPTRFYALTDWPMECTTAEEETQGLGLCQQM